MDSQIKAYRQAAGLSQAKFAKEFEIPLSTVKKWELGLRTPPAWAEKLIIEKLESLKTTSQ